MKLGGLDKTCSFPEKSKQLLWAAFAKHNISIHIDDGKMGGGEAIPFDPNMDAKKLRIIREKFLHGDPNYWRRGVFHYTVITCFDVKIVGRRAGGMMFYVDSFFLGQLHIIGLLPILYLKGTDYYTAMASGFMHELGHNLGIYNGNTLGCDDERTVFPDLQGILDV